jgi:hypothetical protein
LRCAALDDVLERIVVGHFPANGCLPVHRESKGQRVKPSPQNNAFMGRRTAGYATEKRIVKRSRLTLRTAGQAQRRAACRNQPKQLSAV